MNIYIFIILALREYLNRLTRNQCPSDIIRFIILEIYKPFRARCGIRHTVLFSEIYSNYIWGDNNYGQLGLGFKFSKKKKSPQEFLLYKEFKFDDVNVTPDKILEYMRNIQFSEIKCGGNHVVALTNDGKMWVWGHNLCGQLGLGDTHNRNQPQICLSDVNVKKIFCGPLYTIIITQSNETYGWGYNILGQLGLGCSSSGGYANICHSPKKINISNIESFSCGWDHTVALTICGRIYTCGSNEYGQLGLGDENKYHIFTELYLSNILKIECGDYHTVALSKSRHLFVWGSNNSGQLGLGEIGFNKNYPQKLSSLNNIISVSCGALHTIVLRIDGMLFGWGSNEYGQLGLGNNLSDQLLPQKICLQNVLSVSCSTFHTIAVTIYHEIYVCGSNDSGQLGLSDTKNRNIFWSIEDTKSKSIWSKIFRKLKL